jgi:hypothetical protein
VHMPSEDRSNGKGGLELLESLTARGIEIPRNVFPGKPSKGDDNSGVLRNKAVVEIAEAKEGLDVFDFLQFWPFKDSLHFIVVHGESRGEKDITKVLDSVFIEMAFGQFAV